MTGKEFAESLMDELKKMDFANHPFAVKIRKGELSKSQVKEWAKQWYHGFLKDADRWVAEAFVHCPDPVYRKALIENAYEESTGFHSKTKGHPALFREFLLSGLGVTQEELERTPSTPDATASLLNFWTIQTVPWYQFGPLFVTSESQVPLAYLSVIEGLRKHYGVSEEALTFFKIHAGEVDEEHSSWNIRVIEEQIINERDQAEARQILRTTAGLIWNLLNVYQRYN
ncbi:MAG: iron-containing redox enzyme family protein [candidate division NC10 bacterium]